jgi:hypothetical protein
MVSERGLGKGIGMGSRKMVSKGSREGYRNGIEGVSGGVSGTWSREGDSRDMSDYVSRAGHMDVPPRRLQTAFASTARTTGNP